MSPRCCQKFLSNSNRLLLSKLIKIDKKLSYLTNIFEFEQKNSKICLNIFVKIRSSLSEKMSKFSNLSKTFVVKNDLTLKTGVLRRGASVDLIPKRSTLHHVHLIHLIHLRVAHVRRHLALRHHLPSL